MTLMIFPSMISGLPMTRTQRRLFLAVINSKSKSNGTPFSITSLTLALRIGRLFFSSKKLIASSKTGWYPGKTSCISLVILLQKTFFVAILISHVPIFATYFVCVKISSVLATFNSLSLLGVISIV